MSNLDTIVVGSGVAGMTVARLLAESGRRVATCESYLFGGAILNVNELDPGLPGAPASGTELAAELAEKCLTAGVESIQSAVTGVTRNADGSFAVRAGPRQLQARSVVCASGARLKTLDVPGESALVGRGVSQCADCDGPLFRNKDVVVVGGGDSAFQEAITLAHMCKSVLVVHRGQTFRAAPRLLEQAAANPKINVLCNATVEAIRGSKTVEGIQVKVEGGVRQVKCEGVFPYIGMLPNTDYVPDAVERDEQGFLVTNASMETSLPGMFAVGGIRSGYKGTLAAGAEEATLAAQELVTRLAK